MGRDPQRLVEAITTVGDEAAAPGLVPAVPCRRRRSDHLDTELP